MAYYYIPAESRVVELDANLYADWVANGNPKADYYTPIPDPPGPGYSYDGTQWVAPPVYIPTQVTRFQAKATMAALGLLSQAEALVAQADDFTKLAWAEALTFDRTSPLLNAMAQQMGLSSAQLDQFFVQAATVSA